MWKADNPPTPTPTTHTNRLILHKYSRPQSVSYKFQEQTVEKWTELVTQKYALWNCKGHVSHWFLMPHTHVSGGRRSIGNTAQNKHSHQRSHRRTSASAFHLYTYYLMKQLSKALVHALCTFLLLLFSICQAAKTKTHQSEYVRYLKKRRKKKRVWLTITVKTNAPQASRVQVLCVSSNHACSLYSALEVTS